MNFKSIKIATYYIKNNLNHPYEDSFLVGEIIKKK